MPPSVLQERHRLKPSHYHSATQAPAPNIWTLLPSALSLSPPSLLSISVSLYVSLSLSLSFPDLPGLCPHLSTSGSLQLTTCRPETSPESPARPTRYLQRLGSCHHSPLTRPALTPPLYTLSQSGSRVPGLPTQPFLTALPRADPGQALFLQIAAKCP